MEPLRGRVLVVALRSLADCLWREYWPTGLNSVTKVELAQPISFFLYGNVFTCFHMHSHHCHLPWCDTVNGPLTRMSICRFLSWTSKTFNIKSNLPQVFHYSNGKLTNVLFFQSHIASMWVLQILNTGWWASESIFYIFSYAECISRIRTKKSTVDRAAGRKHFLSP
jgi:hypothetical protein